MESVKSQKANSVAELKVLLAKSELDRYFNLFQASIQINTDQHDYLAEAEQTLFNASKVFRTLVSKLRGDSDSEAEKSPNKARNIACKSGSAMARWSGVKKSVSEDEYNDQSASSTSSKVRLVFRVEALQH